MARFRGRWEQRSALVLAHRHQAEQRRHAHGCGNPSVIKECQKMKILRDRMEIDIESPLSSVECMHRIRERTDSIWKFWGHRVVSTFNNESTFYLRKRKLYANPLQTILKIKIIDNELCTLMQCRTGISNTMKVIINTWLLIFLPSGGVFFQSHCTILLRQNHLNTHAMPSEY